MRFQAAKALENLGFSPIESLVYCHLLEVSPATGYRVAQAIGKPTANTYNAIAALAQRGAIIVDDSENRLCRAVPPGELLDRLNREFEGKRKEAESELSRIRQADGDDRVYQLTSVDQLLERARSMLKGAKRAVLLELFPRTVPLLADDIAAAARRGVRIAIKAYAPISLKGVAVALSHEPERVLAVWPGQQLTIAADGEQFLTALLSQDVSTVHQALWSSSTFLSCFYYNALNVEQALTDIEAREDAYRSPLNTLSLTRLKPPGFQRLNERYGEAKPASPPRRARARAK